jgi:predicted nucleic acid-binding protein
MILYFDTSALVKRYIRESNSDDVFTLFDQVEKVGSILLTKVEMASAITKTIRMNWVDPKEAEIAWGDFLSQWSSFTRLAISTSLIDRASRLAKDYSLRAYDAMHLAAAHNWQEILDMPVTIATFDRELWLAAKQAGLLIWPNNL